jgi:phosphoglycerate dehydrogenase-like enzyme
MLQKYKEKPMKLLTADQTRLGFIGLGSMGSRIAQRLLEHGYVLIAYDINPAKAEAVAGKTRFRREEHSGTRNRGRCGSLLLDQR